MSVAIPSQSIRMLGVCRHCTKPLAVEGVPSFERWQEDGKGFALGKVFERSGWKMGKVKALVPCEKGRTVKRTVWLGTLDCECGGWASLETVNGKVSSHRCDSRCLNAFTGDCECECGGENHGKGHVID